MIRTLAEEPRGIVLLTGTTGSGKSTTLAAMIDHINSTRSRHVVTLEDPIEYLHRDKLSIINQREVGQDTESFARAMRRVLRQDPDVILIGEMRDEETVRTALAAAETGPPRALHAPHPGRVGDDQPDHRLLPAAPPAAGAGDARVDPAGRGLPAARAARSTATAASRCARCMVVTGRVQDLILNPQETGRITEVIAEGEYYGMQTFDQALLDARGRAATSPRRPPSRSPRAPTTSSSCSPRRASARAASSR